VQDLLFDDRGQLRPLVNVYLDKTQVDDLDAAVTDGAEIRVVAAIAGG
jgi:molybdopterin converting factor small subunit